MAKDAYEAARDASAIVILTEWNEFRTLDLAKLKRAMKQAVLCDLRNIYTPEEVEAAGWTHVGVGKGRPGVRAVKRVVTRRKAASA
jgi:UDPglucose 6-dehydrogenase